MESEGLGVNQRDTHLKISHKNLMGDCQKTLEFSLPRYLESEPADYLEGELNYPMFTRIWTPSPNWDKKDRANRL